MLFLNLLILFGELNYFLLEHVAFEIVEHVLSESFNRNAVNQHNTHDTELELCLEFIRKAYNWLQRLNEWGQHKGEEKFEFKHVDPYFLLAL